MTETFGVSCSESDAIRALRNSGMKLARAVLTNPPAKTARRGVATAQCYQAVAVREAGGAIWTYQILSARLSAVRGLVSAHKLHRFMDSLGSACKGPGCVYLVGGATSVLMGWRESTVDIDIKLEPEPSGAFDAIAALVEP
jgi:hypothetical protein